LTSSKVEKVRGKTKKTMNGREKEGREGKCYRTGKKETEKEGREMEGIRVGRKGCLLVLRGMDTLGCVHLRRVAGNTV